MTRSLPVLLLALATPASAACPDFSAGAWTCRAILPMDNLDVAAACGPSLPSDSDTDAQTFHYEGDPATPNAALADPARAVWVRWVISDLYSQLHTDASPSPGQLEASGRVTADFVYSGIVYDGAVASSTLLSSAAPTTQHLAADRSLRCHELPAGVSDIDLFELEVETAVRATCAPQVEAAASADIWMSINPQLCWPSEPE